MTDHLKTMQAQEAERLRDYESEHRSAQAVGATAYGTNVQNSTSDKGGRNPHRCSDTVEKAECISWLERWIAQYCQIVPPDNEALIIQFAILKLLKSLPSNRSEIPEIALRNIAYNFSGSAVSGIKQYAAEQLALYHKMMGERG